MLQSQIEKYLQYAVFAAITLAALLQIAVCRGLYADGANMLVNILRYNSFLFFEKHRLVPILITQSPVVFALWGGVTNLTALKYIYSTSLLLFPLILWLIALWEIRKDFLFWPFVLVFTFVFSNAGFFAASESNSCIGLAAICLVCFLKQGAQFVPNRKLLLIAAVLLPFHYALTLFLGPILFMLAWREWHREENNRTKLYWLGIMFLFVVATATGVWEILTPRDPINFSQARNPHILSVDYRFWLTLFYVGLISSTFFITAAAYRTFVYIGCALLLLALMVEHSIWDPIFSYGIRIYIGLAFTACSIGLILLRQYVDQLASRWKNSEFNPLSAFIVPVFILFITLTFLDCDLSLQYRDYIDRYRYEITTRSGLIPYEESWLQYESGEKEFFQPWTHPVMSLLLRDNSHQAIILNPTIYKGYQEFDPRKSVPDLNRFYKGQS